MNIIAHYIAKVVTEEERNEGNVDPTNYTRKIQQTNTKICRRTCTYISASELQCIHDIHNVIYYTCTCTYTYVHVYIQLVLATKE